MDPSHPLQLIRLQGLDAQAQPVKTKAAERLKELRRQRSRIRLDRRFRRLLPEPGILQGCHDAGKTGKGQTGRRAPAEIDRCPRRDGKPGPAGPDLPAQRLRIAFLYSFGLALVRSEVTVTALVPAKRDMDIDGLTDFPWTDHWRPLLS